MDRLAAISVASDDGCVAFPICRERFHSKASCLRGEKHVEDGEYAEYVPRWRVDISKNVNWSYTE